MRYKLTVFSVPQGIVSMVMDAVSAEAACSEARRGGYSVLSATVLKEEAWAWRKERFDLMLFGHELLALMEAGMGLVEAVTLIAERMRSAASQATLAKILMQITQGQSFSSALESAPEAFPVLFVASVRASERTGMLADGIRSYMGYQQSLNALHNKVVSACVYPCVLIAVGSMVVLFLLSYVVPRFSQVYASMEQTQLPLMSRLLMQWGQLFAAHTGLIFSGLIGIAILTIGLLRLTPFRAILNRWLWGLPRVGEQLRIYQLARFTRTVALLLKGGVPLPTALGMTESLLRQPVLQQGLAAARRALQEGRGLAETFRLHGLATEVGVRLLSVGERSGSLDRTMERIAAFYDDENARQIDLFTRMFEPLLMLVMGLLIGGIVILMYLPIFQLASSIQ